MGGRGCAISVGSRAIAQKNHLDGTVTVRCLPQATFLHESGTNMPDMIAGQVQMACDAFRRVCSLAAVLNDASFSIVERSGRRGLARQQGSG